MSLRPKIVLILSCVVALYAVLDNGLQRFMVSSSFTALEQHEAREDLERVFEALGTEEEHLADAAESWAVWDETYEFARGGSDGYPERNLGPRALERADVDLFFVLDANDRVVWSAIEHPDSRAPLTLQEFPSGSFSPNHAVARGFFRAREERRRAEERRREAEEQGSPSEEAPADEPIDAIAGLLATERGPMLVAAHRIRDTKGDADPVGTLVLGRFLSPELIERIGRRARVSFEIWPLDERVLPERERALFPRLAERGADVSAEDDERLYLYETVDDIGKLPEILVRANIDKEITARGDSAVDYALLSTFATSFLILLVLLQLLQKIVIQPLGRLTKHAVEVGKSDDTSVRLEMDGRGDEIGQLSQEFDSMLDKLAKSRSALAKAARLAGMSEIATGVIHNVGNVLNSVNVSASLVARKTEQLAVRDLEMMVGVLNQHESDLAEFVSNDPRGKHLLPFLNELAKSLASQRGEIREELKSLETGIEHIIKLVRSQQAYAGKKGVFEATDLGEQLDEALTICEQSYGWSPDIEVVRELEELPAVPVDRHKLMEILVNVIQNARQSMDEAGGAKRLVLRLARAGDGHVRIEIQDSGLGIAPENLARIFNHGFTTREDGHGFGLHASANAATEMSARLNARSDGPGTGATFVLDLPLHEARSVAPSLSQAA